MLLVAVPALVVAADEPKDNKDAAGAKDAASSTTETVEVSWQRNWLGRVVDLGTKIGPLAQIVLLCLILFVLFGLRSDISSYIDKTGKGGL
jgi:hypothetical protein